MRCYRKPTYRREWAFKPQIDPDKVKQPIVGWLHIWWVAEQPGNQPPARKQYCKRRDVNKILAYWQGTTLCLMKHTFIADVPDVLNMILADEPKKRPLDAILEG